MDGEQVVRNKISLNEFSTFWVEYFKEEKYEHQRLGQAFYNDYDTTGKPFPELFYCENQEKAKLMIFDNYVNINE